MRLFLVLCSCTYEAGIEVIHIVTAARHSNLAQEYLNADYLSQGGPHFRLPFHDQHPNLTLL
jgi:hypothetical protein